MLDMQCVKTHLPFFDSTGRVVPPSDFHSRSENKMFNLPKLGASDVLTSDILKRVEGYLPGYSILSSMEFEDKIEATKKKALRHPQIGPNAFRRCHLTLPIPHIPELADPYKLGDVLEKLLKAAEMAYKDKFKPPRKFVNFRSGTLAGAVKTIAGTRQGKLLVATSKAPQAGILLPNPLQGWSVEATRAIISSFPKFVSLAGIEYILAMIAYPGTLARDYSTPCLDLASLSWQSTSLLCWGVFGDELAFGSCSDYLDRAYDYSGGLFLRV